MIDTFFAEILKQFAPLREKVDDIDDKMVMHKDLSIKFTQDKGKPLATYLPVIKEIDGKEQLVEY